MAETLLTLTNLVAHAAGLITTDYTALTGNSNQQDVDNIISAINEVVDDLSDLGVYPVQTATGTIALVVGTRAYAVASDFVALVPGPKWAASGLLMDFTTGMWMTEYPGGYEQLRADQNIPSNFTGIPRHWTMQPTTGKFYLNAIPQTADLNPARTYSYDYRVATSFVSSSPTATFPFADEVTQRLVPSIIQAFSRERHRDTYEERLYLKALARAAGVVSRLPQRSHYGPRIGN